MFLQKYWDVIGADVSSFCISCATLGTFPKSLNEKVLVLILKKMKLGMYGGVMSNCFVQGTL